MRAVLFAIVVGALLAGCGGASEPQGTPGGAETLTARKPCLGGREIQLGDRSDAYAAVVKRTARAFGRPNGKLLARFARLNVNGVPTVFSILGEIRDASCEPKWYHVQLPIRPNGATGYVAADEVEVYRVRTRIEIDLSERRIVFLRGGREVATVTAGIGASETPTPTGRFYVNQRLRAGDPSGPYGPGGIGISAFSPVLTGWAQGGPIAIHGTNQPDSIGQAASNGCLRVSNRDLLRLFDAVPEGTPVVIRA